jgi:hypothetical protein
MSDVGQNGVLGSLKSSTFSGLAGAAPASTLKAGAAKAPAGGQVFTAVHRVATYFEIMTPWCARSSDLASSQLPRALEPSAW